MKNDLNLYPYKIHTTQALSNTHKQKRLQMCDKFLEMM